MTALAWLRLTLAGSAGACLSLALVLDLWARTGRGGPGLAPEPAGLPWVRAGFLLLGAALVAGAASPASGRLLLGQPRDLGLLIGWLAYAAALHCHHLKPRQPQRFQRAAAVAWLVLVLAVLALGRGWRLPHPMEVPMPPVNRGH